MINGYIDVNTRTGTIDANINSCAKETIEFNVNFDVGLTVAILSVEGKTLALSTIEEATPNSVTINTMTVQAYEHTHELGAGQSMPIVIAIGDSNHLQALVTGRMQFNSLYDKAPPKDLAPAYPTSEELKALLAEMQTASNAAVQSATDARKSAEEAGESATAAAQAAAEDVTALLQGKVEAAEAAKAGAEEAKTAAENAQRAAQSAATSAGESAKVASASEQAALTAKQAAETAQGQAKASETAAKASETAAKGSETSASASEQAAKASEQAAASSETAAASSETAAANSATAAEAAQAAAETAKTGAEAANAAAASSATSAANSAAAAEKSATNLAEAVATAESLDGRLTAIEPSALRAKDGYIGTMNGTQYPDGAFSFNQFIETFWNYGTLYTGANFCAWCTGLKWALASHWDKIATNAFRDCTSLTEIKGTLWRAANMNNNSSEIGANAFRNCTNLEKMPPVSNDVKTLESGYWAGVRIINTDAFYNCRKLPAQFVKDIVSSPALWSIKGGAFQYCCLDSGGIDELVFGKNIVFNSYGAFAESGVKRVDCSQMVKDPIFDAQFRSSQLEEIVLPQRQFSCRNGFHFLNHLRYVKMPPVEPVINNSYGLFYWNDYSNVEEVTVELPITRAEAEAWTKYQLIVLDSFPLEKTVFNFTDEQGVTYNA